MSTTTTSTAPDRTVASDGPGYRFAISIPGYRFTGVPRPELTDDEAEAFSLSGGEQQFYADAAALHEAINTIFPES